MRKRNMEFCYGSKLYHFEQRETDAGVSLWIVYLIFILLIQVLSSMGIPKASVSIILFVRNDFIDITNKQNGIVLRL